MIKVQITLEDESVDILAMMMVGYVLGMPTDSSKYQKKVEVVVEFLEEVLDPNFQSVSVYLQVLELLPATVKRRMPWRISEFIRMYERQIEEALGRPIPALYKPKHIITEEKTLLDVNGNPIRPDRPNLEIV